MLTSKMVKKAAMMHGADLVGIASMDRFEGAPMECDPRFIFPGARSCIVLASRIPRGSLIGIEEGTFFQSYAMMGYAGINFVRMPMALWGLTAFIEDEGYDAVPLANCIPWTNFNCDNGQPRPGWSRSVSPDRPAPDVFVHYRVAAYAAGLGEIGYSKVFLSPEFGPRQRFGLVLTNAPLEADPIYEGHLCDRCMRCAKTCSGDAISTKETVKIKVAGHDVEWGKLNEKRCREAFRGGNPELNPFHLDRPPENIMWHGEAWEGGCGCVRECMLHLESKGVLKNEFKEPFRRKPPWRLPKDWKEELATKRPPQEKDDDRLIS